jgi:two-component system, response regulator PdtaR
MAYRKACVLVVEDDPVIRMGAVDLLASEGFEILEAGNADEAIALLEVHSKIHLVFTDVSMPGTMDGKNLSHYIRDRWPPIKLVVASGMSMIGESDLPLGTKFLPKPYHDNSIIEAIMELLFDARDEPLNV